MTAVDVTPIIEHLSRYAGLSFSGHRTEQLVATLRREMAVSGGSDPSRYVELLERDSDRREALIDRLTIGETLFFREARHLRLLRERILPELVADRPSGHRLQVWSAGCASGEEAYTLALVLGECGLAGRADVLGTDISTSALDRAAAATYRAWSLRGVDEDRVRAYFQRDGERFRLRERFRRNVEFRALNLVGDPYPTPEGGFDVVFCRNVLIYLTTAAVATVVQRLVASLAEGGWLVTASSDPHLGTVDGLETIVTPHGVVYRRRGDDAPRTDRRPRRRRRPSTPDPGPQVVHRNGRHGAAGRADAGPRDDPPTLPREEDPPSLDAQHHHLRAVLLVDAGRWREAVEAATTALYLDPSSAVTEIVLGRAHLGLGDRPAAARAFRNARDLLSARPSEESVVDGIPAGRLLAELDAVVSAPVPASM